MNRFRTHLLAVAILAAIPISSFADIITLSDGTKITGTMMRQGDSMTITSADGSTRIVNASQVSGVAIASKVSAEDRAEVEWKQFQTQLGKQTKLNDLIALLEKFEAANHGNSAGAKAARSIENYKAIVDKSPVKFHGTWMAKDQIDAARQAEADAAKPVIQAYKERKDKEVLELAGAVLKANPENSDVLLPAGLAAYRQNQLQTSRDYFSRLVAAKEESVIGQNNLGVINFELGRSNDGLAAFAQALLAGSDNLFALDNAGEALKRSEKLKTSPNFVALQRIYQQSEAKARATMGQQGLFRLNANWETAEQIDAMAAASRTADAKLVEAHNQLTAAESAANNVRYRISSAQEAIAALEKDCAYAQAPQLYKYNCDILREAERQYPVMASKVYAAQYDVTRAQEDCDRFRPNATGRLRIMEMPPETETQVAKP